MPQPPEDTDTLLALLSSLVEGATPSAEALLDALVRSDGDVQRAARLLNETRLKSVQRDAHSADVSNSRKRKRTARLDEWLSRPKSNDASNSQRDSVKQSHLKAEASTSPSSARPANGRSPSRTRMHIMTGLIPMSPAPTINPLTLLRPPSSESSGPPRLPPLTLGTPSLVAEHTPCTYHPAVLPADLALRLFRVMLQASDTWTPNKWWLFERLVESPHRTSFYTRVKYDGTNPEEDWAEAARYWYNGRETAPPPPFLPEMEEACTHIERVVNAELSKRTRHPLEWAGSGPAWRANVAAANCYAGAKESVGFHSDQLTYLGPYPTIASLSLGTTRVFRIRETIPAHASSERRARTFNIPLTHNSLTIMHAGMQEQFKHAIPPQAAIDVFRPPAAHVPSTDWDNDGASAADDAEASRCRINITFRFYRPDFAPSTIPRCKCGIPCILRADMKQKHTIPTSTEATSSSMHDSAVNGDIAQRYWWCCYSGAQKEGKGCGMWRVMDMTAEGRGPCIGDSRDNMNK